MDFSKKNSWIYTLHEDIIKFLGPWDVHQKNLIFSLHTFFFCWPPDKTH